MVPIEAMLCGTPVIAYGRGGALETVISGMSGIFFDEQTSDSLSLAIEKFNPEDYSSEKIRAHAL